MKEGMDLAAEPIENLGTPVQCHGARGVRRVGLRSGLQALASRACSSGIATGRFAFGKKVPGQERDYAGKGQDE
jgi:hypothetical protein